MGLGDFRQTVARLQIYAERTRSTAATLPRSSRIWQNQIRSAATHLLKSHEFGKAKFAVPQRSSPNPRICGSKFAAPQRSSQPLTNLAKPNSQCRSATSQIPRICGSKFAVPQRSSQPLTNLAKPNSQCRNESSQIPRICGSKFAVPQRFSVEASRLPNTARRRG